MNNKFESRDDFVGLGQEIDWLELYNFTLLKKKLILLITFLFFLSSIVYSFFLPNLYTSSTVLIVSEDSSSGSIGPIGVSESLPISGLSLGTAPSQSLSYATKFMSSRVLINDLMTFPMVKENIMAGKGFDFQAEETIFESSIYNKQSAKWSIDEPTDYMAYEKVLSMLSITNDKETGFIYISFEHPSPKFAKEFVELLISEANTKSKLKDMKTAEDSLKYLSEQLSLTTKIDIRRSINLLIETQLRKMMLANVKDDFLVSPIDPPFYPELKSSPFRRNIVLLYTFLGFFLSVICTVIYKFAILRR